VLRFQRALERANAEPSRSWAELAHTAGYSDQPHLNRDFRELAGISPGRYRELAPAKPNHVPIRSPLCGPPRRVNSVQDGERSGGHTPWRKEAP
jgi:AraC-like DNA-binding protein